MVCDTQKSEHHYSKLTKWMLTQSELPGDWGPTRQENDDLITIEQYIIVFS
jgi:hypothetical protein